MHTFHLFIPSLGENRGCSSKFKHWQGYWEWSNSSSKDQRSVQGVTDSCGDHAAQKLVVHPHKRRLNSTQNSNFIYICSIRNERTDWWVFPSLFSSLIVTADHLIAFFAQSKEMNAPMHPSLQPNSVSCLQICPAIMKICTYACRPRSAWRGSKVTQSAQRPHWRHVLPPAL